MFILLKIGGTGWAAIILVTLILIVVAAGVIKGFFPEKKSKPWKKV